MPDIYIENSEQTFEEAADIYKPDVAVRHGEHDGEEYTVEVRERDLPAGTPPSKAQNINLIEWDEAFYLEWEDGGGLVTTYTLEVEDSNDDLVTEVIDLTDRFAKFSNLPGTFPQNGEEYAFIITTNFLTETLTADEVLGTGEDKTPQNLSQTVNSDGDSELSWDSVTGHVIGYRVRIKDPDTGNIKQTTDVINSTSYVFKPTISGFLDIVVVAVSEQEIFESDESNSVSLYNNQAIQNLSVTLDVSNDQFTASWDPLSGADSYNLYRKPPEGSYQKVNSSAITSTSFTGSLLTWSNGEHSFYVVPVKNSLEGLTPSDIETEEIDRLVSVWDESDNTTVSGFTFEGGDIESTWNESNNTTVTEN